MRLSTSKNTGPGVIPAFDFRNTPVQLQQEQARLLINDVHPKSQHILRTDQEFVSLDTWQKELSSPNTELLIFPNPEKIVIGVLLLTFGLGESVDLADIRYLTVHPDWQKKGVGDTLLKRAEQRSREIYQKKRIGLTIVYHPCCPQEDLIFFYLKRGYKFEKEIEPTKNQQESWKQEFRELARFKIFWKNL
jgi:N-acetylglutamate synthase-like GNAT family acetyltransferase